MADDSYNVQLVLTADDRLSVTIRGVKRDVDGMDDGMKKAANGAGTLESSFKRLQQAMELGIAGAMLQRVGNLASEMYDLGERVRVTSATFEQLTGGGAEADAMLASLRNTTNGIIGDMQLMEGASKYLSMGLGSTSEEVNRLIELAVKLGGAMGNDTASSIENFALLMSNESILRLDTYGISAERVRTRIEQLMETGEAANRSEAFRMAVLEVGGQALDRLGTAAEAAVTPLGRFQTTMENFWAAASQNFAIGVNATVGLVEGVAQAATRGNADVQAADQEAFARGVVAAQHFREGFQTALDEDVINGIAQAAFQRLRIEPSFDLSSPEAMAQIIPPELLNSASDEQWQQMAFLLQYLQEQNAELEEAARLQAMNLQTEEMRVRVNERAREVLRQVTTFISDAARQNALDMQIAAVMDQADMAAQLMAGIANPMGRGSIGGVTLITADELAQIEQLGRQYEQALEAAQELHDQDLISDEQLAYIESGADEMERMRDAARDGAAALRDLSLSQIFGEGGQSQLAGDLSSSFLDAAQSLDLSAEDYQALADTIRLSTGEITDASVTYRDEVLPLLLAVYERFGADAAATALANVETYMRDSAMQGRTPEQIAAGLSRSSGYGFTGMGGGSEFTVNPGDNPSTVAARYGLSVDQVMAGAGITNPYTLMPGTYGAGSGGSVAAINTSGYFSSPYASATVWADLPNAAEQAVSPFQEIETTVGKVSTELDEITSALDQLNSKTVTLKIDLDTGNIPKWFRDMLEQTNRDNGGTSPGTTSRARSQVDAR